PRVNTAEWGDLIGCQPNRDSNGRVKTSLTGATRLIEYKYDGDERLLVIGPDRHGIMLELVAVPANNPTRIIRADRRPTQVLRLPEMR
ncbi:MAG: hypothetical protein WBB28_24030, partial [Crinalium sp.]